MPLTRKSQALPALPLDCKGPKLGPFQYFDAPIDFCRLLSDPAEGHAYVFEVLIKSEVYALKIFKFYDESDAVGFLLPSDKKRVDVNTVRAHMDPFYNECRAYGRLIDKKQNGKLAVHCYGYLHLPATMEDELSETFRDVVLWDRPSKEYHRPVADRAPFRAIVKNLIREDPDLTVDAAKRMLKDLNRMQRLGVYPMDVYLRNYRAGRLIDFSIAMTEPHYLLYTRPRQVKSYKNISLHRFDKMVKDAGIYGWERPKPNREYKKKLRSSAKKSGTL